MPKRILEDLRSVVSDIAQRKRDAAIARNQAAPIGMEAPKDVYLSSCAAIGEALVAEGFKFAKSGPHISKVKTPFRYKVAFQSSHYNIPGRLVSLTMAANVRSTAFKKWRLEQTSPVRSDDWVAGGMVHLLGTDCTFLEWELADPVTRLGTTREAVAFLKTVVLPFFELFSEPDAAIGHLKEGTIPNVDIGDAVEFALCFGSRANAQKILDSFVLSRPSLSDAIASAQRRYEDNGLPRHAKNAYAKRVAWLRVAYGLA